MDAVDKDGVQPVEGDTEEVQTHHNNAETDHIMSSDEELAEVTHLVDNVAGINQKKDQYMRDVEARVTSIGDQKGKKGDLIKVSSLSSPHTSRPVCVPSQQITRTKSLSSPPPCTQPSRATARIPCHPELMSDLSMELYKPSDTEEAEDEAPSAPVVGKGIKHLTTSTNNNDLPDGCQHNNTWHWVFIPTVAHWAGGDVELWGPDNHELRGVMQDIWDHIYKGRIEHEISGSGTVLKVAKQHLMEWHGGGSQGLFASQLKQNRFIFRDNAGLTPKAWTGMWRASFILQTSTPHLNFTYGHVGIPNINTEAIGVWAVFTLAVTAVCHILQLVVDGNITFKIISETRGKHTKATKTGNGDIWTPIIKKGEQFAFSKPVWGHMTQKFMQPIIALPDKDFTSIVQEAQQYAKHPRSTGSLRATSNVMPDEDDGFADLFAFH
ncbi:hypothetical protein EDB19DRAFT_1912380 [Suillus lakei]|nr:hypothetical protein EDB19DRAFT_1912380 [Suillus lakei]